MACICPSFVAGTMVAVRQPVRVTVEWVYVGDDLAGASWTRYGAPWPDKPGCRGMSSLYPCFTIETSSKLFIEKFETYKNNIKSVGKL